MIPSFSRLARVGFRRPLATTLSSFSTASRRKSFLPMASTTTSNTTSSSPSHAAAVAALLTLSVAGTSFAFADFHDEKVDQNWDPTLQPAPVRRVMTKRPYIYRQVTKGTKERLEQDTIIVSGSTHPELSKEIVQFLGVKLNTMDVSKFSDGEISIKIGENVRGKDFFVIQTLCSRGDQSLNDAILELLLTISAARRASAASITAVIPYFAYARQSRKGGSKARTTIAAADLAKMLASLGVDRVLTVDLHSPEIIGCFPNSVNVTNVVPTPVAAAYFGEKELLNPIVVSPKSGGIFRAKQFLNSLKHFTPNVELVTFVKEKFDDGSTTRRLLGDVRGKDCILVDDMMDTGTTVIRAAQRLKKAGARSVYVYACHGLFSGTARSSVLKTVDIDEVIVSNTIPANRFGIPHVNVAVTNEGKIKQLSLAPLLAEAMTRLVDGKSTRGLTRL
jgi:ribose-phosphate pyrophosphokinase